MSDTLLLNPDATSGHNTPPEAIPFEQSRDEIEGLYNEASHWLDGSGVKTQEDADAVSLLVDLLRKAVKTADERRVAENKPFDDGKAEVQARYAPLIGNTKSVKGKAILAEEVCKKALAPYLKRLDDEKRAKAEALRKEAEAKAEAARQAMKARADDLAAAAHAEAMAKTAKLAEADATRAEKDKAHAKGGSRAIGLTTSYTAEVTDARAFAAWVWRERNDVIAAWLATLAQAEIATGRRGIPGVTVHEIRGVR